MDQMARTDIPMLNIEELKKFHFERQQVKVAVSCDKSSVPMLWLDSSILIDFAKIENGENIEQTRASRLSRLRTVAWKAVRAETLICPEWDQALEFEGKRLEPQIRRIASDLSCGAGCVPYEGVKDLQIECGLEAYLAMAESVRIPAMIHFYGDPASTVRSAKRNRVIMQANMPKPREWIAKAENDKQAIQKDLEVRRQKQSGKKFGFEEQLALERVAESTLMFKMLKEFMKNVARGKPDDWEFWGIQGYLMYKQIWETMGGPGNAFDGVYCFMRSPYFWELPIEDISSRLFADLLVHHSKVKVGDQRDIHHLATAIPVAHYIVADNAMVDRCRRLGIDSKWNAKLFSTRTLDDLCSELESFT
jgi:hypothetical protein